MLQITSSVWVKRELRCKIRQTSGMTKGNRLESWNVQNHEKEVRTRWEYRKQYKTMGRTWYWKPTTSGATVISIVQTPIEKKATWSNYPLNIKLPSIYPIIKLSSKLSSSQVVQTLTCWSTILFPSLRTSGKSETKPKTRRPTSEVTPMQAIRRAARSLFSWWRRRCRWRWIWVRWWWWWYCGGERGDEHSQLGRLFINLKIWKGRFGLSVRK